MIPKIIHYCWFGHNPLPKLAVKCIESWQKILPNYEIKEWNENNCDVYKFPNLVEGYNDKNFAFVSNYFRFDVLYRYGGIYFDIDVEVIKDLTPIIENRGAAFGGIDTTGKFNAGVGIGGEKGLEIFKEFRDGYIREEYKRNCSHYGYLSEILSKYGFHRNQKSIEKFADITIYPQEYFCPLNLYTQKLNITDKTYTIHHFANSWFSDTMKKTFVELHPELKTKYE